MTVSMGKNPYRPGVGLIPTYVAGREAEIRRFRSSLRAAPEIPANVRLTGLRGVGKTVLLRRFKEVAEDEEWATLEIELEPRHNTDAAFTATISHLFADLQEKLSIAAKVKGVLGRAASTAKSSLTVRYEGLEFAVSGDLLGNAATLGAAIRKAHEAALIAGRMGIVLLIDEAQVLRDEVTADGNHPLSLLLATVSALQKESFSVSLVLCGLPNLAVNLLAARTYSERMFKGEEVKALPEPEARAAFVEPLRETGVAATEELVDEVLTTVAGYPYFIQLWGAELWDCASLAGMDQLTVHMLKQTEPEIYRRLDLDFYKPRVQSLTPAEQDVLADSAKCPYPPLMVADLNRKSAKSEANVNVLLGRLVQANVLYRPRKGQYLYTAPGFHEYLLRRQDEFE